MLKHFPREKGKDNKAVNRKDIISHFILRLAYCKTEELRRKFLELECDLLKYNLSTLSEDDRASLLAANGLDYEIVSDGKKSEISEKLAGISGVANLKPADVIRTNFYLVPFQQALSLLAKRAVYVEGGFALVPQRAVEQIIVARFRTNLSKALSDASSMFENVSADPRIGPLLTGLHQQYTGKDFNNPTSLDKLTASMVDQAAEANMPLCMKHLHNGLKRDHKLKHWGRLQYGLFLKGAGLEMEEAMKFMESEYTKVMSHDDYTKKYSYNVRHMYGKEGARKNYTPYSCMKIIMGNPPEVGGYHGCPYKHMPDSQLAAMLNSLRIGPNETKEIVGTAKAGHYQVACQLHFDTTHPGYQQMSLNVNEPSTHPNQWFLASVAYAKAKSGGVAAAAGAAAPAAATEGASTEMEMEAAGVMPKEE